MLDIMLWAAALLLSPTVAVPFVNSSDTTTEPLAEDAQWQQIIEEICALLNASHAFAEDQNFTRHLANVESSDGSDPETFRAGYHGGIWQVDKNMFDQTQTPAARQNLLNTIKEVQKAFGIDWPSVKWEDLEKPLYSAIGARLYLQYQSRASKDGIPRSIEDQAKYWTKYYRPGRGVNEFIAATKRLHETIDAHGQLNEGIQGNGKAFQFALKGEDSNSESDDQRDGASILEKSGEYSFQDKLREDLISDGSVKESNQDKSRGHSNQDKIGKSSNSDESDEDSSEDENSEDSNEDKNIEDSREDKGHEDSSQNLSSEDLLEHPDRREDSGLNHRIQDSHSDKSGPSAIGEINVIIYDWSRDRGQEGFSDKKSNEQRSNGAIKKNYSEDESRPVDLSKQNSRELARKHQRKDEPRQNNNHDENNSKRGSHNTDHSKKDSQEKNPSESDDHEKNQFEHERIDRNKFEHEKPYKNPSKQGSNKEENSKQNDIEKNKLKQDGY